MEEEDKVREICSRPTRREGENSHKRSFREPQETQVYVVTTH